MKTKIIEGYTITLEEGKNYLATRPMASGKLVFPVKIYEIGKNVNERVVHEIPHLTYDEANEFINAFNNGKISFAGRDW